ncbi:hypothetical protein ABT264_19340 [Streptomyces virginiae]|uniref:hypothetical protein n=1 Tax=Streptomyces virginiae TaxID=1961 RepID=UPI0033229881
MPDLPIERVGAPAQTVSADLVRSRYLDGQPPVIVIRGRHGDGTQSGGNQIVVDDWKAAENLAYEILEEVRKWPET